MPINQENVTNNHEKSHYQHIQNRDNKISKEGHKNNYKKYIQAFKAKYEQSKRSVKV